MVTRVAQRVKSLNLTAHRSLSPIRCGFAPSFVNYKKGVLDSQYKIVVCPFVLFSLLAIVLSVLLRLTDSDYPLVSSNSSYSGNTIV